MRLLLDTNVWSRVVERAETEEFYRRMRQRRDIEIVVAPATLLELQRDRDAYRRRKAEMLVSEVSWTRLLTEARAEADEVIGEVRRLRPEWIHNGSLGAYRRHQKFWATKIWEASRFGRFDSQHPAVLRTERDEATILKSQRLNQGSFRAAGYNIDTHGLARRLREARGVYHPSEPDPEAGGWESSEPVETWRLENQALWLTTLRRRNDEPFKTSIDWMEPFLNIEAMVAAQQTFGRMWLYEVEAINVPRNWLRWAVRFAQTAAKLEVGNARDEQLACYLPDAELFITNDRRFTRILEAVVEAAPTTVATVRHAGIKEETPSVTAAIEAIADAWTASQPT